MFSSQFWQDVATTVVHNLQVRLFSKQYDAFCKIIVSLWVPEFSSHERFTLTFLKSMIRSTQNVNTLKAILLVTSTGC